MKAVYQKPLNVENLYEIMYLHFFRVGQQRLDQDLEQLKT